MRTSARVVERESGDRFRRALWIVGAAAATLLCARGASAQLTGTGYLFGTPDAQFNLRGGWAQANARGDLFEETTRNLTLSHGDFSGPTFGAELAVRMSPRFDLALDGAWAGNARSSEYRDLIDNNDRPIEQTTTFIRVPIMLNAKYYLAERGRAIGKLAYIPSVVSPWVGVGAGVVWYRFRQDGDFVNYQNMAVVPLQLESSGEAFGTNLMAGADFSITPLLAISADARYLMAHAPLSRSFEGFDDPIDLSGLSVALSFTIRL